MADHDNPPTWDDITPGARDLIEAVRADFPGLSLASIVGFVGPAAPTFTSHYLDAVRKAGLPEE